jgi:hypothetical protein
MNSISPGSLPDIYFDNIVRCGVKSCVNVTCTAGGVLALCKRRMNYGNRRSHTLPHGTRSALLCLKTCPAPSAAKKTSVHIKNMILSIYIFWKNYHHSSRHCKYSTLICSPKHIPSSGVYTKDADNAVALGRGSSFPTSPKERPCSIAAIIKFSVCYLLIIP